ncbi:hypothetical protein JCM17823_26840 [Halorubrum gandharaense]
MNLDELRSVQSKERRKDSLQHLRDAFYDDVAAYIADLRAARDRRAEEVDKPFSDDDVRRMSDEIETAEEVAEAIYERRVGKVVKLASFAAADMPVETEGMTSPERDLFDDLVARIGENKSAVLDVLSGETDPAPADAGDIDVEPAGESDTDSVTEAAPTPTASDEPVPPEEPIPPADGANQAADAGSANSADPTGGSESPDASSGALADAMAGGSTDDSPDASPDETETESNDGPTPVAPEPAPPGAPGMSEDDDTSASTAPSTPETDRTTVRVTRDVGEILGVDDREYDLEREDVVTLPAANADPLLQRDAAEKVE